jgi:hypothetical protein
MACGVHKLFAGAKLPYCALVLPILLLVSTSRADDPVKKLPETEKKAAINPEPDQPAQPLPFIEDPIRLSLGATVVFGLSCGGGELTAAGVMLHPEQSILWFREIEQPPAPSSALTDRAPVIEKEILDRVRDNRPMPKLPADASEGLAYCHMLSKADQTAPQAFARSINPRIGYKNLRIDPAKYRGEVVHFSGQMIRLTRMEPPDTRLTEGIENLYEGWIYDVQRYGAENPICLVFTHLPAGMVEGEKVDYQVSVDGYFYKLWLFKAGDTIKKNEFRVAPVIISNTVKLDSEVPGEEGSNGPSQLLLAAFFAFVFALAVIFIGVTVWLKRGDRQVSARIALARQRDFVEPASNDEVETLR